MFKAILVSLFMLVSSFVQVPALAGPAQQETLARCQVEAMGAVQGAGARQQNMPQELFEVVLAGFIAQVQNDPEVPKEHLRAAVKGIRAGYDGEDPQKVFDTCMALKQAGT
jgi:hypothetical protein